MKTFLRITSAALIVVLLSIAVNVQAEPSKFVPCKPLQSAYSAYAYADFDQAQSSLLTIDDGTLSGECAAQKYMLLGALDVIAFITESAPTLDPADSDFQVALASDPFIRMPVETFPPLLIRNRFERNRRMRFNADIQVGNAEASDAQAALNASKIEAMKAYLGQFFSPQGFGSALDDEQFRNVLLSEEHISRYQASTESSGDQIRVETTNLIQRNSVLSAANDNKILFDVEKPYVRLEISESLDGDRSDSRVALTRIKQHLVEAGFTVIDEASGSDEAHILIRGNVDASAAMLNYNMGYGGTAFSNLTMIWADGSQYNFGSHIEKADGTASSNNREAMFSALEAIAEPLAEHITSSCIQEWNDRMVNGAVYRVEMVGQIDYDDFKKVLAQLSTWTLNDPLDNPTYSAGDRHVLFVRHRPSDGDLADILRAEGFYNLSKPFDVNVLEAGFNKVVMALQN